MMLPSFAIMNMVQMTSNDLGVTPIFQHKDTKMLCLDGCSLDGEHAWDAIHIVESALDVQSCDHCRKMCGYAAIVIINHHYGGNLSQNRLEYFGNTSPELGGPWLKHPEQDLRHGGIGTGSGATKILSWALNNAIIYYYDGKPTLNEIKQWIDQNRPILTLVSPPLHFMVTDGYDDSYLHLIDSMSAKEVRSLYEDVNIGRVWVPPTDATDRNDEPEIWIDSDEDGIVDFDEINRFFTDPNNEDTDDDGINDKQEIQAYTFLPNGTFDSEDIIKPDADKDGYRAELDPDDNNPSVPEPLVAFFDCYPETSWTNETISFNATQSSGDIVSYEWDFNDGNITTCDYPVINHTYVETGNYNVTLKVTDDKNVWNLTSQILKICYITDLNKDGTVGIQDLFTVAKAFQSKLGDPDWNEVADIDNNNVVNIRDLYEIAKDYGKAV